ncbi:hypothetical protein P9222_23725 [Paenibacillus amylolyticus]|nr:hypothetical protein [Paenibacillus amylolyticus]WFR61431.1 hypothetical protein P9222_23725 [Paenibacillus amylolyticus]
MALSRWLVPINYVQGSRYDHDLAGSHVLVPALAEAEQLAAATVGSEAFYKLRTSLVRQANRIGYEIKQAIILLAERERRFHSS